MHVYADTWAHQRFAGVNHEINDVQALDDSGRPDPGFTNKLNDFFGDAFDEVASRFVGDALWLNCRAKGLKSWKHQVLETRRSKNRRSDVFVYSPLFLDSDWKLFHDALTAHCFAVIRDILPRCGICAA
jgi:hypothetical protein